MSTFQRWFGGSPIGVLLKLIFLSLLVGIVLAFLGLTPLELLHKLTDSLQALFGIGFDSIRDIGGYVLTGAVIVIPLFILSRVIGARR